MRSGRRMAAALVALAWALAAVAVAAAQKYNAIFNFGDSITDTGNLCSSGRPSQITFTQPPYGETYFGTPTCRCCDGRVIPDFLCSKFGLPFLPPSKSTTADFKEGANMAITGATAMDAPFFRSLGLSDKIWNNGPISFQLEWFQQVASAVCGGGQAQQADCKSYLANSLFVFGEFGGNDYNAMLFGNYSADQASTYTPQVVAAVASGVEKLVAMGATDIVVPGVLPIGCFPIYLTFYGTSSSADYDSLGCLRKFNDLSTNHNNQLQAQISGLQAKYKSARIMYADFYSAVYDMVKNPGSYGFSTAFQTCCGSGGGKYNYQNSARCGMPGASACSNPAAHLSWDGIHLTEAAYKQITDGWLNGPYCHPAILHS
ncbi:GDSL esterase/lipase [Zea mays]|uniref:GDSL esterase/lipase n=1 Tax=Zea mays TaxID=4577 RepID=A0A3L6ECB4_MAIZE|nr:GDSL esterase/lipase [Zea mays]